MLEGLNVGKFKEEGVFLWLIIEGFLDHRQSLIAKFPK